MNRPQPDPHGGQQVGGKRGSDVNDTRAVHGPGTVDDPGIDPGATDLFPAVVSTARDVDLDSDVVVS
jgi:hypothetical protein